MIKVPEKPIPMCKVLISIAYVERSSPRLFAHSVLQALIGQPTRRCRMALRRAARAGLCTATGSGNYTLTEAGRKRLATCH